MIESILAYIGKPFLILYNQIESVGRFFLFQILLIPKFFQRPFRITLLLKQIESMGVNSLGVVLLTGTFTGMVLSIQMYQGFHQFGAEGVMGYTIYYSVGKELGPVFTSLMIISRAVSAMAAELGTMRVTEQIDAIDILSVDSKHYLIVPRVLAMIIVAPLLIVIFDFIANVSSYYLATTALGVNPTEYINTISKYAEFDDFATGLIKGVVFGYVVASIGTYMGYSAKGGAKGVGDATTSAVVVASVSLFLTNYFLSSIFLFLDW